MLCYAMLCYAMRALQALWCSGVNKLHLHSLYYTILAQYPPHHEIELRINTPIVYYSNTERDGCGLEPA